MKLYLWVIQGTQSDHILLLVVVVHEVFCDGLVRILLERPIVEVCRAAMKLGRKGVGGAGVLGELESLEAW